MLDDVRFTIAAVAKKAYVQELTHFRIAGGRIVGYDGALTLSSPIGVDLNVRPAARTFLDAVRQCEGPVTMHVTPAGRLCVRAGGFRVFVECLPESDDHVSLPEGKPVDVGPSFYRGLEVLAPLMGVDASRPWAMGIKAHGECLYATNNVMVGQFWHGGSFPYDVVIPARAVEELLRVGQHPERVLVTPSTVSFMLPGDRWLKTSLLEGGDWPVDRLEAAMDGVPQGSCTPLPQGFADALAMLKPFIGTDPAVYVRPGSLATSKDDETGGRVEIALGDAPELACYSYKQLELLAQVATGVRWHGYPKPCSFERAGEPLRGLVLGRRM